MTILEVVLCLSAVVASSSSQLCMKAAALEDSQLGRGLFLSGGIAFQLGAVLVAVVVLRTLNLSQLVAFAALAYILVPLGGHFVFGERLLGRFWIGAILIILGILAAVH